MSLAKLWIWVDAISIVILIATIGVYLFFTAMHLITGRLYRRYWKDEYFKAIEEHEKHKEH